MATHFSERQLDILRAALDRIIPGDDFPGGWAAGCGDYIARQLDGQLAHLIPAYRDGLDGLDAEAGHHLGYGFVEAPTDQQDMIMARVEAGDVQSEWRTTPDAFFSVLVSHAAEGYYADPGQGGNRNRVSWRMIGFHGR